MSDEKYIFQPETKKALIIAAVLGIILVIAGILTTGSGSHGADEHQTMVNASENLLASTDHTALVAADAEGDHHGETAPWLKRLFTNLWINNVYFTGIAIIGLCFVAIQYAASAGWSAGIKRIPLAMASWLPFAAVLMIAVWFVANHDIFHWTHTSLYGADGDDILKGKQAFFFWPLTGEGGLPIFYILRMVIFFGLWYMFFIWIKKEMLAEDLNGGTKHWFKLRSLSAIFLIVFAVSSSISAWDWVMSIDPHWFSTMFGWYVFASWWVTGLAGITFGVIWLKEKGYLKIVNENHLHDLGKFVFAFSIFWAYIWFSQFLLIYYANIPEETIYFIERMKTSPYSWVFYVNLIANFLLPFLLFMTRDAKRKMAIMKLVAIIVFVGHWFDFYLMISPGVMKQQGGIGFMEIGMTLIFGAAFIFVMLTNLAKVPLVAKNHPMLEESLHHHT
ncbi:MAG: quinol:cytochrome C oxidoreductase [Cyclobacteriaceae bacterium]|nr:quinol:cytochrome C oxidoreductase [Cyclobacteriaceae bacterium]